MPEIRVLADDRAVVGESPMWSVRERALYWLDGRRDAVYRLDWAGGARAAWSVPGRINALALADRGLVVGTKAGVGVLDTSSGRVRYFAKAESGRDDVRMNDGKIDRAGRFWFGTMQDEGREPIGEIYRLAPDGRLTRTDDGFGAPNGFAWSPAGDRMYLADSRRKTIYVYDVDLASGTARNRRPFATPPLGSPDGATVDAEGYLWSACTGGFAVVRYAPDGSIDRTIRLPAQRPTSVMLAGPELTTLVITTATRQLTDEELAAQPLSGALLAVDVDVPGLPEPEFSVPAPS